MDQPIVGADDTAVARFGACADARDNPLRNEAPARTRSRRLAPLVGALVLLLPLLIVAMVRGYGPQIERDAYTSLEIAARLKAQFIESWLAERHSDGKVLAIDAEMVERIAEIQRRPDPAKEALIRQRLEIVQLGYGYGAIHLLDPHGKTLLAIGQQHDLSRQTRALLPQIFANGETAQSDFYLEATDGLASLNFVVPLQRTVAGKRQAVAALVMHAEPDSSFFPKILAWPSASPSGETLLVRGEGESVIYLNQLRHVKDSALKLKQPLADPTLPAAIAILTSQPGTVRGKDYRGIEVLTAYRPIAGTDWHLVTKLDHAEVMAPLWKLVIWVGLVAFAAIAVIIVLLRLFWSQQDRLQQQALRARQEQDLRESEARFRAVAETARDAIVTADAEGKVVAWNSSATRMFGFAPSEIIGQPLPLIIPARYRQKAMDGFRRLVDGDPEARSGRAKELIGRRKDDSEFLLDRSVAVWETEAGRFFTCTMRDITKRKQAEMALQQSEEKLRAMTDNISTVMFLKDLTGRYLHVNRQYETLFHISREAIQGQTDHDIFPREAADAFVRNDQIVIQSGQSLEIEEQVPHDDGIHSYISHKFPICDASGQVYAICGIATDITERKQQEEQTKQLLAENQTILSNALVGIVYLKQRRIVSCNRRFEELFHYGSGELIGESTERLYDTSESFLALGQAYSVLGEGKSYTEEVQMRHKDGSLFWGALTGCAIDPARPNDGSIWVYADISERRRAEQESNKLLQAVEQSQVSIIITNRKGVIEYVNPCFTRISGYTREEAIGQTPRILKSEQTPVATHRELWRTILAGRIWRGALRNRCKSGDLIWEETSISPIFSETGEITHFVAVKEDVTERKKIEQQLELHQAHLEDVVLQRTAELSAALEAAKLADRSKDEFLANITHELRTPLSAVIGFSSLARPFCTDARQRDYLDKVSSAGKTLSGIIDDLLDLSKIVAGRMEFEASPFSLRQLVVRSSSVISYQAEEKGLELGQHVDDDVPDVLVGDSLRVEQILLNLLSNAVKFTSAGRVELRVGVHAREERRLCLNIEVEDTGIGMRDEEIALLFKPFSQADASMTRKFGGTGLGLAICKRLAELMDGDISVSSREGLGTTFQVRLWLGKSDANNLPVAREDVPESSLVRYQDARVLVVDDQPFNRDVVEGLLAAVGISPRQAGNGREAFDILSAAEAFDLVLMDVQMPVMDGLTATRMIRRLEGLAALPIVAMTAHTMAHEREKSFAAGMNDHIGKPFDEAGFYRMLAKWIPRDKQRQRTPAAPRPAPSTGVPPLRGVDTRAGLALLLGDEARYRHWLADFVVEAPAAMTQIRLALAAAELEPASMAAHTLKGRMGLLGMKELHDVAAALETAIDHQDPAERLQQRLEQGVAAMCEEIRSALGLARDAIPVAATAPESPPPGAPPASVARLIASLQTGDSDCDSLIAACLDELAQTPWAPCLRRALALAQNFDYAAAIDVLAADKDCTAQQG